MKHVTLITDGSWNPKSKKGGWAALLRYENRNGVHEKMLSGAEKDTTIGRMELKAVAEGVEALNEPCNVMVVSDSQYVVNCGNSVYQRRKHLDLWEKIDASPHRITFRWVRGHNGHAGNERVDAEANRQRQNL